VFIIVAYFVIDLVRKRLVTSSYNIHCCRS